MPDVRSYLHDKTQEDVLQPEMRPATGPSVQVRPLRESLSGAYSRSEVLLKGVFIRDAFS